MITAIQRSGMFRASALGLAVAMSLLGLMFYSTVAKADVDPPACNATGGSIILTTYRADGTTPVGGGTVVDGETIKYKATLGSLPSPVCAYQNGAWSLTTPDGVVHDITPGGGVPRIGGTGVASLNSALISYVVNHANEIVGTYRHVDASTLYSNGISHINASDNVLGPTLGTSAQTIVIHTPVVATNIHDPNHGVVTSAPIGSSVHDNATVTGEIGGPAPTGNVAFNLYATNNCTGATTTQIVALTGNTESSATTVPVGGLSYKAFYQGDSNYTPALGLCEPLTATRLTSSVTTNIHNGSHAVITSAVIGSGVHDNASVTGSGPTPTGTVVFNLYTNSQCDSATTTTNGVLSGGIAESGTTTVAAGGLGYRAYYNGDATYNPSFGICEPLTAIAQAHLIVDKVTSPSGDAQSFGFTTSGTGYNPFSLTDAATPNDQTLVPGTYTVNETAVAGWSLAGASCSLNAGTAGPYTPGSNITLAAGDTMICVFTNTKQSHLIVDKVTSPSGDPASFSFTTTGTGYNPFSLTDAAAPNNQTLAAGNYTVNETPIIGWNLTGASCSVNGGTAGPYTPGSTITLAAGDTVQCTFNNTKVVTQWCSHGYWKQSQHFGSWVGYSPSQLFSSVFENAFPGKTLLQVLQQGGGGLNALGRDTVGELLNTAAGLSTGWTTAGIIAAFNAAFPGTNSAYDTLHNQFVSPENCPLGRAPIQVNL
jgi:hypothetical protein